MFLPSHKLDSRDLCAVDPQHIRSLSSLITFLLVGAFHLNCLTNAQRTPPSLISISAGQILPAYVSNGALPQNRGNHWRFHSAGTNVLSNQMACQNLNFGSLPFTMNSTGFSLTMTFAWTGTSAEGNEPFFQADLGVDGGKIILQRNCASQKIIFTVGSPVGNSSLSFTTTTTFAPNTTFNFAVIYSSINATVTFYVNGLAIDVYTVNSRLEDRQSVNTFVGRTDLQLNTRCLSGAIFAMRIDNNELNQSSIKNLALNLTGLNLDGIGPQDGAFVSVAPGSVSPSYTSLTAYPTFGKRFLKFDSPGKTASNPACQSLDFGSRLVSRQTTGFSMTMTARATRLRQSWERIFAYCSSNRVFHLTRYYDYNYFDLQSFIASQHDAVFSSFTVGQDVIFNFAITYDPITNKISFWVDGIKGVDISYPIQDDFFASNLFLGRSCWEDFCFCMDIFSFKTFNRVISSNEIQSAVLNPILLPVISVSVNKSSNLIANRDSIATRVGMGFRFPGGTISNNCPFLNFGSEILNCKTSGFTATVSLQFQVPASFGVETIFEMSDLSSGTTIYLYRNKTSNTLMFGFNNMNSMNDRLSYKCPEDSSDVYQIGVAYTAASNTLSLWVNGSLVASKISVTAWTYLSFSHIYFGSPLNSNGASGDCFAGVLTRFDIYERVLSNTELVIATTGATLCQPGLYMNESGVCQACPPGTFKTVSGNSIAYCQLCPAGTYSVQGDVNCTSCPRNAFCSPEGSTMFQCIPGFTVLNNSCIPCSTGTFKSTTDNSLCKTCPLNAVCQGVEQTTFLCNSGFTLNQDASGCSPCLPDTFKSNPGNFNCTPCPSNGACAGVGKTNFECVPGFMVKNDGSGCAPCNAGTFKPTFGNINCTMCPSNADCSNAALVFFQCEAGFTLAPSSDGCILCPPGTFKPTVSNDTCSTCPPFANCTERVRAICPFGMRLDYSASMKQYSCLSNRSVTQTPTATSIPGSNSNWWIAIWEVAPYAGIMIIFSCAFILGLISFIIGFQSIAVTDFFRTQIPQSSSSHKTSWSTSTATKGAKALQQPSPARTRGYSAVSGQTVRRPLSTYSATNTNNRTTMAIRVGHGPRPRSAALQIERSGAQNMPPPSNAGAM